MTKKLNVLFLLSICSISKTPHGVNSSTSTESCLEMIICQWWIQDFPEGGANSQKFYCFVIFWPKTAWNERIWTPRGGASLAPPLDPQINADINVRKDKV